MNLISDKTPNPIQVIWLGVIGFAFGIAVILYQADQTEASQAFISTPGFLAWLFLISSVAALAIIFFFPVIQTLRRLDIHVQRDWRKLLLLLLGVAALLLPQSVLPAFFNLLTLPIRPLRHYDTKILIITGIAYAVVLLAILGIYTVHTRLSTLLRDETHPGARIAHFLQLRSDLQRFLTILGLLIGVSILATGMLRNITVKQPGVDLAQFPPEIVLAYGGMYTLLVAIVYIPTFMTLSAVGQQLCESIFPLPESSDEQWGVVYDKRKKLEALLQIQSSVTSNFTDNVIIAAPLIGSAISLLLK